MDTGQPNRRGSMLLAFVGLGVGLAGVGLLIYSITLGGPLVPTELACIQIGIGGILLRIAD